MCGCTKQKAKVNVEATKPVAQYNPKFDAAKPVQTRDGRKVRILTTDRKSDRYPIIALVTDEDGNEEHESYTAEGRVFNDQEVEHPEDLVNVPTKQIAYVNVYRAFSGEGFNGTTYQVKASREEADRHAGTLHTRIARLRVEFEPGQMDE